MVLLPGKGPSSLCLLEADKYLARSWGRKSEPQRAKWQTYADEQYQIYFSFASLTLVISLDAICGELYRISAHAPGTGQYGIKGSMSWLCTCC